MASGAEKLGEDPEVAKWTDALQAGKVEPRSYMMKMFLAEHKAGTPEGVEFAQHTTHKSKREFRNAWAERKTKIAIANSAHRRTFARTEGELGNYLAVGPLVIAEGGWEDPAAVRAAKTLVAKALKKRRRPSVDEPTNRKARILEHQEDEKSRPP